MIDSCIFYLLNTNFNFFINFKHQILTIQSPRMLLRPVGTSSGIRWHWSFWSLFIYCNLIRKVIKIYTRLISNKEDGPTCGWQRLMPWRWEEDKIHRREIFLHFVYFHSSNNFNSLILIVQGIFGKSCTIKNNFLKKVIF